VPGEAAFERQVDELMRRAFAAVAAAALAGVFASAAQSVTLKPGDSWNTAYHAAAAGDVITLSAGTYSSQTLTYDASKTSSTDVVFQPASGATVTINGDIDVLGAKHITIRGVTVSSWIFGTPQNGSSGGARMEDMTFENVKTSVFFVRAAKDVTFTGGQIGPNHDAGSSTIGTYSGLAPSENVVIENTRFFDIDRLNDPSEHVECLFIQDAVGTVIRNDVFDQCEVFDIYMNSIVGVTVPKNTLIEGNTFGAPTPTGYYAIYIGSGNGTVLRNNKFLQMGLSEESDVVNTSGCGNTGIKSYTAACSGGSTGGGSTGGGSTGGGSTGGGSTGGGSTGGGSTGGGSTGGGSTGGGSTGGGSTGGGSTGGGSTGGGSTPPPPPPSGADLSVTVSDSPDPASLRSRVTYTVRVKNAGPASASNARLTFRLPTGASLAGPVSGCIAGPTVTCSFGTLSKSASKQVKVTVVFRSHGRMEAEASVTSSTSDPKSSNNSATAVTTVR